MAKKTRLAFGKVLRLIDKQTGGTFNRREVVQRNASDTPAESEVAVREELANLKHSWFKVFPDVEFDIIESNR